MGKKFLITTYGCQMNVHESEKIAGMLLELGYTDKTDVYEEADIIVFNTCCIRENAEDHAYGNIGMLKKLKKQKPSLIIAVGGCMTQQKGASEKLHKTFPFVDVIFGTLNLDEFKEMVEQKQKQKKPVIKIVDGNGKIVEGIKPLRTSFPNAWVNIMYGCNNFCTYCIVPYVRGRERSRNMQDIIDEVSCAVKEGYKEITLLGQNVNSYGNDIQNPDINFSNLLRRVSQIEGDFRIRFMSNHPKDLTEDLVKVIASSDKICHSIHLPIQSGSTKILKLMNRKYTKQDIFDKVDLIKKYIPDCAITTDIMVGFPTETEEDFLETLDVVDKVRFSGAFTFVYSPRNGTVAAAMEEQISDEIKKDRIMRLVDKQNAVNRDSSAKYLGKTIEILCEDFDKKRDMYLGRDVYGRMGYFKANTNLIGKKVLIKITKDGGISLLGEFVKEV